MLVLLSGEALMGVSVLLLISFFNLWLNFTKEKPSCSMFVNAGVTACGTDTCQSSMYRTILAFTVLHFAQRYSHNLGGTIERIVYLLGDIPTRQKISYENACHYQVRPFDMYSSYCQDTVSLAPKASKTGGEFTAKANPDHSTLHLYNSFDKRNIVLHNLFLF